ncbi:MAG: hypothetical protein ACJ77K_02170 [Bacteroidia bacterium]
MKTPKKKKASPSVKSNNENKTPGFTAEQIKNSRNRRKNIDTSKSDLTPEDLDALGPDDNLAMDGGYDEDLRNRTFPVDFAGKDLDVPGAELDDAQEEIGEEDEENNLYSEGDTE